MNYTTAPQTRSLSMTTLIFYNCLWKHKSPWQLSNMYTSKLSMWLADLGFYLCLWILQTIRARRYCTVKQESDKSTSGLKIQTCFTAFRRGRTSRLLKFSGNLGLVLWLHEASVAASWAGVNCSCPSSMMTGNRGTVSSATLACIYTQVIKHFCIKMSNWNTEIILLWWFHCHSTLTYNLI